MKLFYLIICILLSFSAAACTRQELQGPQPATPEERSEFYKWTSMEVLDAFRARGLEAEDIKPGFIVGVHRESENTIFLLPSFGKDVGGVVSCFNSEPALLEFVKFYNKTNEDTGRTAWRISRKDNVVLLISGKVPQWISRQYERALTDMNK
ncbi:MAG: hypothetical protein OEU95_07080 [Nitrospirota bacterium]|nr:hypothetical protein [Nitrospirota bacterium]